MRKFFIFMVAACFVLSLAGGAMAVGKGKKIEYDEKTTGKVIFSGDTHAGFKCAECHTKPKLFGMKKTTLKMADMNAGKSCGTSGCHDGKKGFSVKDCAKCHKK